MKKIVFRLCVLFAGIAVAAYVVPGIEIKDYGSAAEAALLLGILNLFIKPVILILTIPVNLLSLGLFTFVINGFLLWLAARLIHGVEVAGFATAILGAVIISIISISSRGLLR